MQFALHLIYSTFLSGQLYLIVSKRRMHVLDTEQAGELPCEPGHHSDNGYKLTNPWDSSCYYWFYGFFYGKLQGHNVTLCSLKSIGLQSVLAEVKSLAKVKKGRYI